MLRFYGNLIQEQIGEHLGISQIHVFRLLIRALGYLHDHLSTDPHGDRAPTRPGQAQVSSDPEN